MKIDEFKDENFYLSNFYPCIITYEGYTYQNAESAFQAAKCINVKDRNSFTTLNPSESKKLGRKIPLRKDWEDVKISVMRDVLTCKFTQHPELMKKLLATDGIYLEEGNTWGDKTWGCVNGQGANLLGKLLMELRETYLEKDKYLER